MAGGKIDKLRRFLSLFNGNDHVLVVINADPDAIASAMAVKRILWRKIAGLSIGHINVIERPDNIAMIRLLGIPMIHADAVDESKFSRIVMVDSQPSHNTAFDRFIPHAIIDHHPDSGVHAEFSDIRPKYGATASILTEYLRAARIRPSVKLATGLFHAIKTDTSNFQRQTLPEDLRAFQFLFKHCNLHLAQKIEQAELKFVFLKYFKRAIETMRRSKGKVFVHLGTVSTPDVCVLIADFFLRVEAVSWSVVSGLYQKKIILIFRSDGFRKNAGALANRAFGELGSAGGHKSMARAEIPLSALKGIVNYRDQKTMLRWIRTNVEKPSR